MQNNLVENQAVREFEWKIVPPFFGPDDRDYDVAFLLAPNIPLPGISGNAIASLVTTLAEEMKFRSIIFCTGSTDKMSREFSLRNSTLAYYKKNIEKSIWDKGKILPIVRHFLITPINYGWRKYARDATSACIKLGVKCLVVEDVADFGWAVRKVRKHGIKVILHQHAYTQRNYKTYLWKRIERNLDKVIFVANKTREMTQKKHGALKANNSVIYNGVNLIRYDPHRCAAEGRILREQLSFDEKQLVITFVGRFTPAKGLLELLEGYHQLGRKDLGLLMVCGWDGLVNPGFQHQFDSIKNYLERENYNVRYLINVSQIDMPVIYAASDIIIVPSTNNFEGLPKVVSEALAMGVPVIASDRGGTWELLSEGQNGWKILDPVSPQTIQNVLLKMINTGETELAAMKNHILTRDRPNMDQKRMVEEFQKEISSVIETSIA